MGDVTQLLAQWGSGDRAALDSLTSVVYAELRKIANGYLRRERRDHTLQPTALVHEAWMRLVKQDQASFDNRKQFFALAAQIMRRILVDHARAHYSAKRGGTRLAVSLKDIAAFGAQPDADLLALHDVLNRLEEIDPVQARLVELRFFGGLTIRETAVVMQISHATVEREWRTAKAFIKRELTRVKNS